MKEEDIDLIEEGEKNFQKYTTFFQRNMYCNPVNFFFDEQANISEGQIPIVRWQHNYKYVPDQSNCIEMSIEDEPRILNNIKHEIKKSDITKLKKWVKLYKDVLLNWTCKYWGWYLYEDIEHKSSKKKRYFFEHEINMPWYSMSDIRPIISNLPTVVFYGDGIEYDYVSEVLKEKYVPRIKFIGNKNYKHPISLYGSMSIEDEPRILNENFDCELTENEIQQIKDWVKLHKDALLKMTFSEYCEIDLQKK